MSSKEDAKKAVLDIAKEYGFVDEQILRDIEQWNPEYRRLIEESMLAKDKLAAHSIKTLAKNIYGSDARFIFELLQNADDNRFQRTTAHGDLPSIAFHVHPGRIIVECNEDGFTKRDLSAICSVGQSTKSGSHGYIGAKGIGFKSVFIAAWKVYIQSGHFSFYFKHQKDDLGLGMVLPVWVDSDNELPGSVPMTRMTLHLHDQGDPEELGHLRDVIFKQLADLQPTCLLFLRNLRRIQVTFYGEDGCTTSSMDFSRMENAESHLVTLRSAVKGLGGMAAIKTEHFHVTRHLATNLSRSQNRELSGAEEASRAFSTAEVVLAFPLTASSAPVIGKQEIFAFLPVEESTFKFLIQSDFDTTASRQSIMTTSKRNIDLLDGVANALIKAVLQFCEHRELCYTWPQFLPRDEDKPSEFWSSLYQKIRQLIKETPILKSRHWASLRRISDVSILVSDAVDENGEPLLDCPVRDPHLSGAYPWDSTNPLQEYGLKVINFGVLMELLESDLKSSASKMKARSTSEGWQSAIAKLFSICFENKYQSEISRLKQLLLLPLAGGAWVPANSGVVHLPSMASGILIPAGLDLRVLDPSAVDNPNRMELFKHLGAVKASNAVVRSALLEVYSATSRKRVGVAVSKAHLHFLYLDYSHQQKPSDLQNLYLYQSDGTVAYPHRQDIYLPGDHPYGPEALLEPEGDAPGHQVAFLHPAYFEDVTSLPASRGPSWREWLVKHLGLRDRLRIVSRDTDSFTDLWDFVAQHRPKKLLGLLEHSWQDEDPRFMPLGALWVSLANLHAGKLCGRNEASLFKLRETWLPLPSLQRQRLRFMAESEPFPFLELEETGSAEELTARWGFLMRVGVKITAVDEIDFLQRVLYWMFRRRGGETFERRVLDLYATIEAKLRGLEAAEREDWIEDIQQFIDANYMLLVPNHSDFCSKDVVWEGPPEMMTTLKVAYTRLCDGDADKLDLVTRFVKQTLKVRDANWRDITEELKNLREDGSDDFDRICGLYRYLSDMDIADSRGDIRLYFESCALIFVLRGKSHSWYKTSQCLWSSAAEIQGKAILDGHYEDLEDFFLKVLGVKTLTAQIVYDDLKQTSPEAPVERVKNTIESFSSLLRAEASHLDPRPLLQAAFLPVRHPEGLVVLSSAEAEFGIVDREYLGELFRGRIKLLDYALEDVRRLAPFFQWAGLERCYLTRCAREITSASRESTRPISRPSRRLKSKAHAILRVAATFSSPRYGADKDGLYQLLRTAQVLETDRITTVFSVSQGGRNTEMEEASGDVHIEETSGGLRIFVPSNRKMQEVCFHSVLPSSLATWLMRDPITQIQDMVENDAVMAITSVLAAAADQVVINQILNRLGIIQVLLPREAESDDEAGSDDEAEAEGDVHAEEEEEEGEPTSRLDDDDNAAELSSSASSRRLITPDESSAASDHGADRRDSPTVVSVHGASSQLVRVSPSVSRPVRSSAGPRAPTPGLARHPSDENRQYVVILDKALRAARAAAFPSRGSFAMGALQAALPAAGDPASFDGFDGLDQIASRFRSTTKLERDKKIGAAGELYVFELFSRLNPALSGWSVGNWQSTIRKYVAVHPDYADMQPWYGIETADITYEDSEGDLTALLVDRGYLDEELWRDARPRYFIEVKSTTGPCGVPFYMSKGQYQRMKDVHERGRRGEVYVILRVFDIGGNATGMQVYVDPEQLRLDELLAFTAETWSVVPGPSP